MKKIYRLLITEAKVLMILNEATVRMNKSFRSLAGLFSSKFLLMR